MASKKRRKKHIELVVKLNPGARVMYSNGEVHTVRHVAFGTAGWSYQTHCGLDVVFPRRMTKGLRITRKQSNCVGCLGA